MISLMTFMSFDSYAACSGTTRTWTGASNDNWNDDANWDTESADTTGEDAVIVNTGTDAQVNADITVGCVTVNSGVLLGNLAQTLTVHGDFTANNAGTINATSNNFNIDLAGSSEQTLSIVDDIRDLTISNTTTVNLANTFRVRRELTITGNGTTNITGDVSFQRTGNTYTIPAGHTMVIKSGAQLFSRGNLTVNGVLKIEAGATLQMYRNTTFTIAAGGVLQLTGASGNVATIVSEASNRTFVFNMAGTMTASNFSISRTDANGVNITGSVTAMDDGEFRGIRNNGYALTLGAASSMPSTMDNLGFFNDDAVANPNNINATAYTGGGITLDNFTGDVGGDTFETDPGNDITWNTPAATELSITNDAESGEPQAFFDPNDRFVFAEFAFALTQADTATDITSITFEMTGSGADSDLDEVEVWADTNGNCDLNTGGDTLIEADLALTGTPPRGTVTFGAGVIQTSGPTDQACVIIRARAATNPQDNKTIQFGITGSSDITNSQGYSLSSTSGVPITGNLTTIRNNNLSSWNGSTSTSWNTGGNWDGAVPNSTTNCQVGAGSNVALSDTNPKQCANATLSTGGTMDWNSTSNEFEVYGTLDVQSGYTFNNAANGIISFDGTTNQSMTLATAFPGNVVINNSGGVGSNIISAVADSTINGDLTCTDGTLTIVNGVTVTVLGDVTVQTGCELDIDSGGTLALGNGSTVTIDAGGTLRMVGASGAPAQMTSVNGTSAYNVIVNGTIEARYYSFARLDTTGVSIEAGATIDASLAMLDGTFTEPINNSTTLLFLKQQVPGNTLSNMVFDDNGTGVTGITAIDTTGAAAGTLTVSSYSGNLTELDTAPAYTVVWTGATTTIDVTVDAAAPATVAAAATEVIGRFGFTQADAGASFVDTDITTLTLQLTGTGTASDISAVKIYSDSDCDSASGTLLGTSSFAGSPAIASFAIGAGNFTVAASATTPPKNCIYVEVDMAASASDGNTIGASINSAGSFVDDQGYGLSTSTPAPIQLGNSTISAPSSTIWTGTTSTDWTVASNWTDGVPNSAKSCTIPNVANDPIIATATTAACESINITGGIVTINGTGVLEFYQDFSSTGTLSGTGTLRMEDPGATNQNFTSTSTIPVLDINKNNGGFVYFNDSSLTINSLTTSASGFNMVLNNGKTLVLPNGFTHTNGVINMLGGSEIQIGNGQTLTVAGGDFRIVGTNDAFPQAVSTKGVITAQGGGTNTWNFTATSGNVRLTGFQLDRLGNNGLNIGGTTVLNNLDGGQLTNLSASYASMTAIQLNTSGTIPTTSTNVAWTWGDFNSFDPATANTPANTEGYTLVGSTGCGSQTIDFTGWTGDWYETTATFDVTTKVSASGCTINLGASASVVSLTSFEAVPYNAKVDIRWETNMESNHKGFNIYRANEDATEFQQVNASIIKNVTNAGNAKGRYRFIDSDVDNGETYYYYLEDVDLNNKITLHGPRSATPLASLGNPPADEADENSGGNDDDGDDGGTDSGTPINNPSYKDLGNGVVIQSQTTNSIRINITPATPVFTASAWDGSYEDVAIAGYSKITTPGFPELPQRVILLEVYEGATNAQITNETLGTTTDFLNHKITPAPDFVVNGSGGLDPVYAEDATTYATNANIMGAFYSLESDLISSGNKKYLKLTINPLNYNPVQEDAVRIDTLTLDIGLGGNAWETAPGSDTDPMNYANTLRIDYAQEGIYALTYDNLVDSYVEGPFDGADINELRLYYKGSEIPLSISSGDGVFNSGDTVIFYAPYEKSLEDNKNTLVLTNFAVDGSSDPAKRMTVFNSDPTGENLADENFTFFQKTFEQNLLYIDGESLNDTEDHYVWGTMFGGFPGFDAVTVAADLSDIDPNSDENVRLKFHVKGQLGLFGNVIKHAYQVSVGGQAEFEGSFESNDRIVLEVDIPADRFIQGVNNIEFKILGTFAYGGDYDRAIFDKLEVEFVGKETDSTGHSLFTVEETEVVYTLAGFSSNTLNLFDISDINDVKVLDSPSIYSLDGGTTYDIAFYVDDIIEDSINAKKLAVVEGGNYLTPTGLSLNPGTIQALKNPLRTANMIILGHRSLLEASDNLVTHREEQGMQVLQVDLDQVYREFSNGMETSEGIRSFIQYALNNWAIKPSYLLILGDATLDPLNHDVNGNGADVTATEPQTMAMPMFDGRFIDFGADNFYGIDSLSHMPQIAIGRLPSNDPLDIENYIEKVISYETGDTEPLNLESIALFADSEQGAYEKFREKTDELSNLITTTNSNFSSAVYDHAEIGEAATKSEITSQFNDSPFIISLMGHGASDRWGATTYLNSDLEALSNGRYPILITWNCETAYHADPAKSTISFAEKAIFNETGGAIVFLGSNTQTTPSAQMGLARNFFSQMMSSMNSPYTGQRIGDYFKESKIAVGTNEYYEDIVNSFTIIGDPSLRMPPTLYPVAPEPAIKPDAAPASIGCDAGASDGRAKTPWHYGLIEFLMYLALIVGFSRLRRKLT